MMLTKEQIEEFFDGLQKSVGFSVQLLGKDAPVLAERLASMKSLALAGLAVQWRPIEEAPKDGTAFLGFGIHDTDNGRHWQKGDYWKAILLYDVYREVGMGGARFVFSKDGARTWSEPMHYIPLSALGEPPIPEKQP